MTTRISASPGGSPVYRAGIILPIVTSMVFILGILGLGFYQMASHSMRASNKFLHDEIARRIAESALDEAQSVISEKCRWGNSDYAVWLRFRQAPAKEVPLSDLPLTGNLLAFYRREAELNDLTCKVTASRRDQDFTGPPPRDGDRYYGQEGHGTVVLKCQVTIAKTSAQVYRSEMERHHDYKVLCLVSSPAAAQARVCAANRMLDYVLYVEKGREEYVNTCGTMLNSGAWDFSLDTKNAGRIFLGDASVPPQTINLSARHLPAGIASAALYQEIFDGPRIKTLSRALINAHADLKQSVQKIITRDNLRDSSGNPMDPGDCLADQFERALQGRNRPTLRARVVPFSSAPQGTEKEVQEIYFPPGQGNALTDPMQNFFPSGLIVEPFDFARLKDLLEGELRQRFFHVLEESQGSFQPILGVIKSHRPGFSPPPNLVWFSPEQAQELQIQRGVQFDPVLATMFSAMSSALAAKTTALIATQQFGDFSGTANGPHCPQSSLNPFIKPFSYTRLGSLESSTREEFDRLGVLSGGGRFLDLRGWTSLSKADLVLGDKGPVEFVGQGLLSCGKRIIIKDSIRAAPQANSAFKPLCLLRANGDIVIDTNPGTEIEAVLITFGRIVVNPGKALKVKGAIFCRNLGASAWGPGPHALEYNETVLRCGGLQDEIYAVTLSPELSFLRIMDGS